jgi:chaperonin GroEL
MGPGQLPKREIKKLQYGTEARAVVLEGARKLYEAVSTTFGPSGNNVLQGMPFGDPVLTRDGVTVAKRTIIEDRAENDAASVLRQASEKTNKTAGDGTTSTVVLGYHLLNNANQQVVAGANPMKLKSEMQADSRKVIEYIKKQSVKADKHLLEVATVSSGDANIGALVADTIQEIGADGGISIREQSYPTLDVEKINGYYFNKGFFALNQPIEWKKPLILVTQKAFTAASEILPIIQMVNNLSTPRLIIVGDVRGEALQVLLANTATPADPQGRPIPFEGLVIQPPAFGDEGKLYMEDIAVYVGGKLHGEADGPVLESHYGTADSVKMSQESAIFFGGAGTADDISTRAAQLKETIGKTTNAHQKDALEQRYSKLVGKIAIVNVGAATQTEMEELRFRVEDAIEATKSAMADGVVPGSGTVFAHAVGLEISPIFRQSLIDTFAKLYENAGESAEYRLQQVRKAKKGYGFNLRDISEEPVDLAIAGIWDATRAVIQTVENATSAASSLLTVGALVTPYDEQ